MVQTVFLLEKMVLELGKAAQMAFGREVCRAKLHYSSAAYVGPSGPWTLQRVHTQTPLYKPRCFHAAWPGWVLGPSRAHTQAASWGSRCLNTISRGCGVKQDMGIWNPVQGFHLEWNPKP